MDRTDSTGTDRDPGTPERLLMVGLDVFGRIGFQGATTRMLAETAGVNQQAIAYHFGSKEGLYLRAVEATADYIVSLFADIRARVHDLPDAPAGQPCPRPDPARELLTRLLQALARVNTAPQAEAACRIMMREQANPTRAFAVLYDRAIGPITADVAALVARMQGKDPQAEEVRLLAVSLIGSILIFLNARPAVTATLGWDAITEDRARAIEAHAARLVALIPGQGGQA